MSVKLANIILQIILTILFFSIWTGFALLIVNPNFHAELPGYQIGQLCVWEGAAIVIAGLIAHFIYRKWQGIALISDEKATYIRLNVKYGYLFLVYIILASIIGIWQFWLFSQKF